MAEYLVFATEEAALDRSKEAWEAVLGRKKNPEDVTEFLWATDVGKDGQTALVVDDDHGKLTQQEITALVADLPDSKGGNWEKQEALPSVKDTEQ